MRVVRFHVNWRPPSPPPPSPSPPPPPDLNCKLLIAVFPAGPKQQSISDCSPPDLNCKLVITVFPAGPEQQAEDQSVPRRNRTVNSRSKSPWTPTAGDRPNSKLSIRVFPAGPRPQRISKEIISDKQPEGRSENMSGRMPKESVRIYVR